MKKRSVLSIGVLSMLLLVAAAYNPASATTYAVGVKVGDTADYSVQIGLYPNATAMHLSVYGIVGTTVTLNSTLSYPNGTVLGSYSDHGDIATDPGDIWLYLIAKNLTTGDALWQGSTLAINGTGTMTAGGASRSVVYLDKTFSSGFVTYFGNIWWDRETGIAVKTNIHISVSWPIVISVWFNATLTSTSLWSAGLFGLSWTQLAIIGVGAVVLIAVIAILLRRRH